MSTVLRIKWGSTAGPRQTKAVSDAISKLNWRGKTRIELNDSGSHELTSMCGEPSEASQAAQQAIGEKYGYSITAENYRAIVADLQAATDSLELPVDDCRTTDDERRERAERLAKNRAEQEAKANQSELAAAVILAKKPAWAEAVIVAELIEDKSDSMTDYYGSHTTRRVVIGWRKGKREDFRQLRAAAATFEPTSHMGPGLGSFRLRSVWAENCPEHRHYAGQPMPGYELDGKEFPTLAAAEQAIAENAEDMRLSYQGNNGSLTGLVKYHISETEFEHRENYSMGAGNYLKAGSRNSDGWRVVSCDCESLRSDVYEDGLPVAKVAPVAESDPVVAGSGYTVQKHFHTKRQCDIWAVVLSSRVERAEFERLRDLATSAGGWFSAKWGSFPGGFCFASESQATEWAAKHLGGNDGAELSEPQPEPTAPPTGTPSSTSEHVASRLRDEADKLQPKIDERTRPMTQNYTPKRGREYNSRCHDGENLRRCQKALRALADLHQQGTCPAILNGLRAKSAILPLVSTAGDSSGYYDYRDSGKYKDTSEQGKALQALISDDAESVKRRALDYAMQELRNTQIDGFFPTPPAVIALMLEHADIQPGMAVLEPSAGAGHIADAIRENSPDAKLHCCEANHRLREVLKLKGHHIATEDCLRHRGDYQRIVMNPPFERGLDGIHVRDAYDNLSSDGRIVAIVGAGIMQRSDSGAVEFREWLDSVGADVYDLPSGSFAGADAFNRTGVSTKMIVIDATR